MIRREIHLPGAAPQWLLVSQIEHARISGVLAEHCIGKLGQAAGGSTLSQAREELLAAIVHHDDGWEAWEAELRLDDSGRPPSFRELPFAESLPISTASIDAASKYGDLAAWAVAGHFLALLESSAKPAGDASVGAWREEMSRRRADWLVRWREVDPPLHSEALAAEALAWLQLADVMSLWLCSVCPGGGECVVESPESYRVGQGKELATEFSCDLPADDGNYQVGAERCRATIDPWRFDVEELAIDVTGWIVPIREYLGAEDLKRAMSPYDVRWLLTSKG